VDVIGLSGTHDYISDIGIRLKAPSGTEVTLFDRICDWEQHFNLNLDDASTTTSFPCPPVGGLTIRPQSPLAAFNGQNCNGTWTLTVQDHFSQDGGTLQAWGLRICLNSGSLPVSWLDFAASRNDKAVLLQWRTASEVNNKYYEVQRSSDGVNFVSIGIINAGNAPAGVQQYLFNDLRPFAGVNYYRLKQVDQDGKFSYSVIAQVTMPGSDLLYTLQPNPARGEASLLFYTALDKAEIRIMDMMGKMVGSVTKPVILAGEKLQLPVQQLAAGQYLVIVVSEKARFTEKLIIQ
jgi:subtilisin-like proprotein convertase family protein